MRTVYCTGSECEACATLMFASSSFSSLFFFFFFQAEDGIRDRNVTGVQTCALPIYSHRPGTPTLQELVRVGVGGGILERSEERRVGKECRSRRTVQQQKKNRNSRPGG